LRERGADAIRSHLDSLIQRTQHAASVLRAREPSARLAAWRESLGQLELRQTRAVGASMSVRRQAQSRAAHALELLGPRQTLARGFTMTLDAQRRPLTSAAEAAREDKITTVFADGEVASRPEN
jgi:exodeoxyribonuclease VII large subunit